MLLHYRRLPVVHRRQLYMRRMDPQRRFSQRQRDGYGHLYGNPFPRALCGSAVQPFHSKSVSAPTTVPAISYPPQSRKRPLPQSGGLSPFRQRCSSESPPGPPCPTCHTNSPSRRQQSVAAHGPTPRRWGPTVHLCLGLCVKDRYSLSPRVHYSALSSSPCPASRARSIRRSGQGRVASVSVAYERYASGAYYDRADSGLQLVRLLASPPPAALCATSEVFPSFSLACCYEFIWMMSSEANVIRLCAALDKLRFGSVRGSLSRPSVFFILAWARYNSLYFIHSLFKAFFSFLNSEVKFLRLQSFFVFNRRNIP